MADESAARWAAGLEVVRLLRGRGYEAYLVGGCVRDRMLGRALHDIDIASSATPEQVMSCFRRCVPTGLKHGTVTVIEDGRMFEVTTFRTESGYSDARRPDEVTFVSDLREDLARRDFTINAMAVGVDGEMADPFGGRQDVTAGIVRCVGDADVRFREDALRMLRAIRFAAEFRFRIALSAWRGIRAQAERLRYVSMERVGSEWDKMMAGADPSRACSLLLRSGLLLCLKEPLPAKAAGAGANGRKPSDKRRTDVQKLNEIRETDVRWAAFLTERGASQEEAGRLCRTLRLSGKRVTRISAVVGFDRRLTESTPERAGFLSAVLDFGRAVAEDWLQMIRKDRIFHEWLAAVKVDSVAQLAVRGDELARSLDKPAGPWVALLLRRLLEEVARGRLPNEKPALLRAAAELERSDSAH